MTKIQIKFLECIYKEDLSAKELCKKLRIKWDKTNIQGGCYNALNRVINYNTTDDGNEIDTMFEIEHDISSGYPDIDDTYSITKEGTKYIEDYWEREKEIRNNKVISIIVLMVSIISVIISLIGIF